MTMMHPDEIENLGDGYRNEYQRAMAWSQMQPVGNEDRVLADWCLANGYCCAVELTPRHCRITDAVIGDHVTMIFHDRSRLRCEEEALAYYVKHGCDPDSRIQVWPAQPVELIKTEDSEIPF